MERYITIPGIFDAHTHLRDGIMMRRVVPFTKLLAGVVAMGNTSPSIDDAESVINYSQRVLELNPDIMLVMSVMLTKRMRPERLERAFETGARVLKLIPNATSTNSEDCIALDELERFYPVLAKAQELGMVFAGHWERVFHNESKNALPPILWEEHAIPDLDKIVKAFPKLRITAEHASTRQMIEYVQNGPSNLIATLAPQYALLTFNDVYPDGKLNPLNFCRPVFKRESDRQAVAQAMTSGNKKFLFGFDSAPHDWQMKTGTNPKPGLFMAPVLSLLPQIFEQHQALDNLQAYSSNNARTFYDLPAWEQTITFVKRPWTVPLDYEGIPIFMGGQSLDWMVA